MVGDEQHIKLLMSCIRSRESLLREILAVLESGADFQLGPKGKHRNLLDRIRKVVPPVEEDS